MENKKHKSVKLLLLATVLSLSILNLNSITYAVEDNLINLEKTDVKDKEEVIKEEIKEKAKEEIEEEAKEKEKEANEDILEEVSKKVSSITLQANNYKTDKNIVKMLEDKLDNLGYKNIEVELVSVENTDKNIYILENGDINYLNIHPNNQKGSLYPKRSTCNFKLSLDGNSKNVEIDSLINGWNEDKLKKIIEEEIIEELDKLILGDNKDFNNFSKNVEIDKKIGSQEYNYLDIELSSDNEDVIKIIKAGPAKYENGKMILDTHKINIQDIKENQNVKLTVTLKMIQGNYSYKKDYNILVLAKDSELVNSKEKEDKKDEEVKEEKKEDKKEIDKNSYIDIVNYGDKRISNDKTFKVDLEMKRIDYEGEFEVSVALYDSSNNLKKYSNEKVVLKNKNTIVHKVEFLIPESGDYYIKIYIKDKNNGKILKEKLIGEMK